jgi:hypothetical protein
LYRIDPAQSTHWRKGPRRRRAQAPAFWEDLPTEAVKGSHPQPVPIGTRRSSARSKFRCGGENKAPEPNQLLPSGEPNLVEQRTQTAEPSKRSIMELHGLGAEIWQNIDAQRYVDELRDEWDRRP